MTDPNANPFLAAQQAQAAPPAPSQQQAYDPAQVAQQYAQPQQAAPAPAQTFPGQVTPAEMQAHQNGQGFNPASSYAPETSVAQAQNGQHPMQQHGAQAWTPEQHAAYAAAQAQQFAQQQAPPAPTQGMPGQPWSPAQHQQNVPQAYAPPTAPQQQMPAQAPQGLPQAPFPGQAQQMPGGGFPGAQAAPQGAGFDPSMFGAPSAGGGTYPKVRDLDGRLCLFRVKKRDAVGTAYGEPGKTVTNYIANVAVLDGGALYSSGSQDDPMAQPTLVSETVPYVIGDLTIGQIGMQSRLKQDFVRGRVVRMPKGEFEKGLMTQFPGMEAWQALWTWLSQDPNRVHQLKPNSFFWGIVVDDSPQADQLVGAFAQNPISRELML